MDALPGWLQAGWWGLVAGAALLLGAWIGVRFKVPQRLVAAIMAFGSGVLISALSFELMDEAIETGGLASTAAGFLAGALVFTVANWMLAQRGARHRKRSRRPVGQSASPMMPAAMRSPSAPCSTASPNRS